MVWSLICTLWMLLSVSIASNSLFMKEADPCSDGNHEVLVNQTTRSTNYNETTDLCDRGSWVEQWYRVISPSGNDMPTECVPFRHCGTLFPMWLNCSIPIPEEREKSCNVCTTNLHNCCDRVIPVRVKNCGSYRVYYLPEALGCKHAYCFGAEVKCPDGYGSENGFTPNCTELKTTMVPSTATSANASPPSTSPIVPTTISSAITFFIFLYFSS